MKKTERDKTKVDKNLSYNHALLRLHAEPCVYYNEMQIHQTLMCHVNDFMDTLERFYFEWKENEEIVFLPRKQVFSTSGLKGDFRVMPCIVNHFEGKKVKVVKVIGTNEEEQIVQDKISVGKALLIHQTDNFVEAIFDVCALSSFRTAAISVLAYKHSVDFDKQEIGIIGAGRIGFYTAVILHHWLGVKKLIVCDTNMDHSCSFKQALEEWMPYGIVEQPLEELCKSCTSLFLVTTSRLSLISADDAEGVDFISSVGADADNLSELDHSLVKDRKIISESRQNVHFGDLKRWEESGLLKKKDIIELRDMIGQTEKGKHSVIFVSAGTAVQDTLICQFLFDRLKN